MAIVPGLMLFVTLLYIVGLGSVYWYAYDLHIRDVDYNDNPANATIRCNVTLEIHEGLFQVGFHSSRRCADSNSQGTFKSTTSSVEESKLSKYRDICKAKKSVDYPNWCKFQNATISMTVLALLCALFATCASLGKTTKPAVVACLCLFSFIFGMIAMAVYAAQNAGFWVTEQNEEIDSLWFADDTIYTFGDRSRLGIYHSRTHSGQAWASENRRFHFSFAFIIIGWILSLVASVLGGIRDQVNVQVVPAPIVAAETGGALSGGQAVATELQ